VLYFDLLFRQFVTITTREGERNVRGLLLCDEAETRAWPAIEQPVVWKFPDGVIMHPDIPI
jgi:hypothetical protein